jgi:hypothetical protein
LFSFSFQRNWNPVSGSFFCIESFEILPSVLIQAERCASELSVSQSNPARCAEATLQSAMLKAIIPINFFTGGLLSY